MKKKFFILTAAVVSIWMYCFVSVPKEVINDHRSEILIKMQTKEAFSEWISDTQTPDVLTDDIEIVWKYTSMSQRVLCVPVRLGDFAPVVMTYVTITKDAHNNQWSISDVSAAKP